jgi:hypothetical protein
MLALEDDRKLLSLSLDIGRQCPPQPAVLLAQGTGLTTSGSQRTLRRCLELAVQLAQQLLMLLLGLRLRRLDVAALVAAAAVTVSTTMRWRLKALPPSSLCTPPPSVPPPSPPLWWLFVAVRVGETGRGEMAALKRLALPWEKGARLRSTLVDCAGTGGGDGASSSSPCINLYFPAAVQVPGHHAYPTPPPHQRYPTTMAP